MLQILSSTYRCLPAPTATVKLLKVLDSLLGPHHPPIEHQRMCGLTKIGDAMDMNDQQKYSGARDQQIRAALDQHWAASDANDFEAEHRIYHEDAVLDYPQSGERTRGRSNIQNQRASQPSKKRFTIQRMIGSGDLWSPNSSSHTTASRPTPSASWSSGETRLRGKHSTLRIHSWLPHRALNGSNGWTHNLERRENSLTTPPFVGR